VAVEEVGVLVDVGLQVTSRMVHAPGRIPVMRVSNSAT
jgi:hypothetical protein